MKIFKIIQSDLILSLVGGLTIGFAAISLVEPDSEGHKHVYGDARAVTVQQTLARN